MYKNTKIVTGIRPSSNLTLANFIGSVMPLLQLQELGLPTSVFVATMHGLTDHEPKQIVPNVIEVAHDYLTLGLDPKKVTIFDQRDVRNEVALLKLYLERHVTIARMVRVPTLKEKLRQGQTPEQASALLAAYPIMMAADIFLQEATLVSVGKDQFSHMEVARELARNFNKKYGRTLFVPETMNQDEPVNILSLVGDGKMSKSKPEGAIFLTDNADTVRQKMKRAQTANPGERSEQIDSLTVLSKTLSPDRTADIDAVLKQHNDGKKVMVNFKELMTEIILDFTISFQKRRQKISEEEVCKVLSEGGVVAKKRAQSTLRKVEIALGMI